MLKCLVNEMVLDVAKFSPYKYNVQNSMLTIFEWNTRENIHI